MRNSFLSFVLLSCFFSSLKKGKKLLRTSKISKYTGTLIDFFFFFLSDKGKTEATLTFVKEEIHGERRFLSDRQEAIQFNH